MRCLVRRVGVFARSMPLSLLLLAACAASGSDRQPKRASTMDASSGAPDAGDRDAGMTPRCNVTAPTSCPDPAPHYQDVAPIIMQRCYACHDGTGEQWPLTSYSHVADWATQIRGQMVKCTMPPPDSGMTMPDEEREAILAWVRCGFLR